ncbi:hypothetical protein [Brevundimonas sp. PAMC22021]|uniref:hypothetical protein n=1 Tax=Brevundimonas sp. PAMC22021 TaxID=2861285 RepID=UPI001C62A9C1|nr:hypothetical protein [Brevundimonas sp. PAMC22021]QYF86276.1 hypothetical protein KY493_10555 [Brevundimonas sp. PAMC22021]
MFEFGKDLRKLFAQARQEDDLGWVELIGADLLRIEARQQSTDAGRVSCARPFSASLRACALWREHARRTGAAESLARAHDAAQDAVKQAGTPDQTALAAVEVAHISMIRFDLCGGIDGLEQAEQAVAALAPGRRAEAPAAALGARIEARLARLSGDDGRLREAAARMDAALQGPAGKDKIQGDELRMERAGLALEIGVMRRDPALLDEAGRDLAVLIDGASPDYRPLTRARALALCGTGLSVLAALAGDADAAAQGRAMFEAAADQFTPDHSPLDWIAIQLVRSEDEAVPLLTLTQCESLTQGQGLILGALARERRIARETALVATLGDVAGLDAIETRIRARLIKAAASEPLAWAADQIGMAHVALARTTLARTVLTRSPFAESRLDAPPELGLILTEAAVTAREQGALVLAERAERLLAQPPMATNGPFTKPGLP